MSRGAGGGAADGPAGGRRPRRCSGTLPGRLEGSGSGQRATSGIAACPEGGRERTESEGGVEEAALPRAVRRAVSTQGAYNTKDSFRCKERKADLAAAKGTWPLAAHWKRRLEPASPAYRGQRREPGCLLVVGGAGGEQEQQALRRRRGEVHVPRQKLLQRRRRQLRVRNPRTFGREMGERSYSFSFHFGHFFPAVF